MGIRLYDSAWVVLDGHPEPLQARKDRTNAAAFNVGEYQYDIDGRPLRTYPNAPAILTLHSLQSAREAGLRTAYDRDIDPAL